VFKHGEVPVSFSEGVATLTGTVESIGVKEDAENAARKDEGVRQVDNKVTVSTASVNSTQILNEAQRKIVSCYANTIFDNIEIEVHGNTLVVLGKVT
jgi:osmotically-inducible protein OsmY